MQGGAVDHWSYFNKQSFVFHNPAIFDYKVFLFFQFKTLISKPDMSVYTNACSTILLYTWFLAGFTYIFTSPKVHDVKQMISSLGIHELLKIIELGQ